MASLPHLNAANPPIIEGPANMINIPSNISRERPPQYKQQVCGCHCHTGNGCHCTEAIADPNNSNSNERRGGRATISDTKTIDVSLAELDIGDGSYESDSDIDLDSGVEALRDYEFLHHIDDIVNLNSVMEEGPDDLDSSFNGPVHLVRSPRRLLSPAASMEVNFSSAEQSLRSSMAAPSMQRSGTPSYYIQCMGLKFHEPTPPSTFLELTPPLNPAMTHMFGGMGGFHHQHCNQCG